MMLATRLADFALVLTAATGLVSAVGVLLVRREVKTANGQTIAKLADLTEGRRVEADIPEHARTESEQHYVDNLNPGDTP